MNYFSEIWRGKDLYRILLNAECARHTIAGRVLDVGSGTSKASYHRFLKQAPGTSVEFLDLEFESKAGEGKHIDLEKDSLPSADASVDTALLFNVLEHIYNYQHLLKEIRRSLKPGGTLLGVAPFLVGYHPDPHDYWRYTSETLNTLFAQAGFTEIKITPLGRGPISAAFLQYEVILPRLLKLLCLPLALGCDLIITKLRPRLGRERFVLGLFFVCKK